MRRRIEHHTLRLSLAWLALIALALASPGHATVPSETLDEAAPEILWSLAGEPDLLAQANALATPVGIE